MSKPHIHAELIKAWADGAVIQFYSEDQKWTDCTNNRPVWSDYAQYRIKRELTDLENYGVEVGDVWVTVGNKTQCVIEVDSDTVLTTSGNSMYTRVLQYLVFRRGVVNKL